MSTNAFSTTAAYATQITEGDKDRLSRLVHDHLFDSLEGRHIHLDAADRVHLACDARGAQNCVKSLQK